MLDSKKESIFSKILKPKPSSCCSMQIVEESEESTNEKKRTDQRRKGLTLNRERRILSFFPILLSYRMSTNDQCFNFA